MAVRESRSTGSKWSALSPLWLWLTLPPAFISVLLGISLLNGDQRQTLQVVTSCMLGVVPVILFHMYRRDLKERSRTQEALRQSEERYRKLVELSPNGVAVHRDGKIVYINPSGAKLLGARDPDELLGRQVVDFIHPEFRAAITDRLRRVSADHGPDHLGEEQFVRLDGSPIDVEVTALPFLHEGAQAVQMILRDITERRHMEEALHESEERLRTVVANIPIVLFALDRTGAFTLAEGRGLSALNFKPGEVVGKSIFEVYRAIPQVLDDVRQALSGVTFSSTVELQGKPHEIWYTPLRDLNSVVTGVIGLAVDISERKAAEEALRRAKEQAETASRAKSEFLANMSHEIRTPMNGVLGMIELVLGTELGTQQRDQLEIAKYSAQSLLLLLNDILDLSKIEAGRFDLVLAGFSLRRCIDDAVRMLAVAAQEKKLDLRSEIDADVPDELIGDPVRLRQIVLNLAGNAIKFTNEGEVVLRVKLEGEQDSRVRLKFSVTDTGIGIPEEKQSWIFEPFRQADGSMTRRYEGTGLGLAICTRLVELMGGHIAVESQVGKGSTFFFTAPFLRSYADPTRGPGATYDLSRLSREVASVTEAPKRSLRILLAEDNIVNQKVIVSALNSQKHEVMVVANGHEALAALERQSFDVILMDVQMPGMDGFETTAAIRAAEKLSGQRVPIVAMTAHAMKGDRERCIQGGMDDYLTKPLDLVSLRKVVEKWTAKPSAPLQPA